MTKLFTIILCLFCLSSFAGVIRAGYLTYTSLGNFSYQVNISLFVSSPPGFSLDSLVLQWGDGDSTFLNNLNIDTVTNSPAIIKAEFSTMHTYSGPGVNILTFHPDNRIAGIINITSSEYTPFILTDTLHIFDPGILYPNNSVVINNSPVAFASVGNDFTYNPTAYDPDGDSLSFQLVPCIDAPGYQFPDQFPPGPENVFIINSTTGEITWDKPQEPGIYNVGVLIREYRMPQFEMGSTYMELEIIVNGDSATSINAIDHMNLTSKVYPNPFVDFTTIELDGPSSNAGNVVVNLYDLTGGELRADYSIRSVSNHTSIDINRNSLPAGLYFYEVKNQDGILAKGKLVCE